MSSRTAIALSLSAAGLVLALAWTRPVEQEPPPRLAHFAEFDRLIHAAATGDLPLAAVVARDLTAGPEAEGVSDADEALIGGALGFIPFAETPEELAEATARAAAACGACHASLAVPAPQRGLWSHAGAADWLAHGLVWHDEAAPPAAAPPSTVTSAWSTPLPEDTGAGAIRGHAGRTARALTACAGCHGNETRLPESP